MSMGNHSNRDAKRFRPLLFGPSPRVDLAKVSLRFPISVTLHYCQESLLLKMTVQQAIGIVVPIKTHVTICAGNAGLLSLKQHVSQGEKLRCCMMIKKLLYLKDPCWSKSTTNWTTCGLHSLKYFSSNTQSSGSSAKLIVSTAFRDIQASGHNSEEIKHCLAL
ncbi:uncharacterized protein CLUP02_09482 [Colletotrichum lupini]|uniref:Uncharacterized protein n=1 Tax=Colletotrichum lupini TaxID=145971 RepID=A0A9Q8SUY5_9PEZI|nr:uncharacterized protein CLUP02_09482 [Colletotrichum lupini]UQC83986.1 hypothetical protein CLUP02_09482 [Colletotrichum lupini]